MENNIQHSPFRLNQFLVADFRITRKPVNPGEIKLHIRPAGKLDRKKKTFTLQLDVEVSDENKAFDIKLTAVGIYQFKDELVEEHELSNYFLVNAPAIMFPYIRAYISTVTALSGLHAVNLPVLNLTELQEQLKSNIVEDKN